MKASSFGFRALMRLRKAWHSPRMNKLSLVANVEVSNFVHGPCEQRPTLPPYVEQFIVCYQANHLPLIGDHTYPHAPKMLLEDQRFLHEDLERLEQGISDRTLEDPRHVRHISSMSLELC